MATGERTDPYRAFNFRIEIDGLSLGSSSECSGLFSEGNAVEYSMRPFHHPEPGLAKRCLRGVLARWLYNSVSV